MVLIKLKSFNYLPWRALFAPIFRRYKLLGIIDGTEVCPSPFLPDRSMNPAFEDWYEKDQNLLIWLNSTLLEEIIPFTSISAYLQQIKEIADSLQAAGASVSDHDLIAATLHGLLDEFESFIDSIMLRLSSTSLDELHGLLLTKELSMARRKAVLSSSEPFQAFSVQSQPPLLPTPYVFAAQHQSFHSASRFNSNRGKPSRGNFSSNRSNHNFHNNNRGTFTNNRGNRNYQGPSNFKVPCQICGSTSHEALDYFDRINPDICGRIPPAKLAAMCVHHSAKPY
ncbi:unnamed protein product [Malus baccata var. baccata]